MYSHLHSKKIVSRLAAVILAFSPVAGMSFSGSNIPSISGSPQMNIGGGAGSSADSVTSLVVILFSNEKDTLRDTLTSGMIPALEIESVSENTRGKFTSISVQKTESASVQKGLANNDLPVHHPVW